MRAYRSIIKTVEKYELPIFKDVLASAYMDLETSKGIAAIDKAVERPSNMHSNGMNITKST